MHQTVLVRMTRNISVFRLAKVTYGDMVDRSAMLVKTGSDTNTHRLANPLKGNAFS